MRTRRRRADDNPQVDDGRVVVMRALAKPAKAIIEGNRVYRNYDRSKRRYRRTGSRTIVRMTIKPGSRCRFIRTIKSGWSVNVKMN
jgi:hypothetical protein